ncbi:MAG: DUF5667 domain-containing protein, partial [bacterium]|nr:DUF5667 domain-containing protein [bacterium]
MNVKIQFRKVVITSALIISIMMPVYVSAAQSAGIKPSSLFYFLDITMEKLDLFFTFNAEKKVEKALAYAEEHLVEIEAVGFDDKPDAVKKAVKQYQQNVELATAGAQGLKDKKNEERLLTAISESTSKHQEALTEIYNKAPDNAKTAIE